MNYCISCELNLGTIELLEGVEGKNFCPKCELTQVIEITNKRLIEVIKEINTAFYNVKDVGVQNNVQELIRNVKKIEIGEKKLKKEMLKRNKQLTEIEYELEVIIQIATKLNYNLEG